MRRKYGLFSWSSKTLNFSRKHGKPFFLTESEVKTIRRGLQHYIEILEIK